MTHKPALLAGAAPRAMFGTVSGAFNPMLRGAQVAFSPDDDSGSGALTVDAAIASLLPAETVEQEAPEAPAEAAEESEEPKGEASSPEEAEAEPEEQAEAEETEAEDAEPVVALDPPKYWSQDAKAEFAALPPSLQAVVLAQEGPREEAAAKAKAEAAAEREAARKDIEGVKALAEHLSTFLPEAVAAFRSQWGATEPDWEAVIEEYGAEEAAKLQARFTKQRNLLAQTHQAQQIASAEAQRATTLEEFGKLTELDPELAPDPKDPRRGAEKRAEIVTYLHDLGIPKSATDNISAVEMVIAKKAKLWDQAQAAIKAAPKPKPAVPVQRAPVRPSAAQAQSSPQRAAQQVANRFAQTKSFDDAVAVILARQGSS